MTARNGTQVLTRRALQMTQTTGSPLYLFSLDRRRDPPGR